MEVGFLGILEGCSAWSARSKGVFPLERQTQEAERL